ncbi:uncharacterized protein IL334_000369 [Kwoniella shivajii]|uniref:Zn(2)-C6 fungal-type domain-containing protein n=1 Tax=Kwoniella shivajii TaxID=564305 RepID=A0ABZ1CQ10_9TREE|nr:hypothetical protein IL334_000369 [Kwoniella shivajii]
MSAYPTYQVDQPIASGSNTHHQHHHPNSVPYPQYLYPPPLPPPHNQNDQWRTYNSGVPVPNWMNWSVAPSTPSTSNVLQPSTTYENTNQNQIIPCGYHDLNANANKQNVPNEYPLSSTISNSNRTVSAYVEEPGYLDHHRHQKDHQKADTHWAGPATKIDLGTGNRFQELLETKMSLMAGGSPITTPSNSHMSTPPSIPPSYRYDHTAEYPLPQIPTYPNHTPITNYSTSTSPLPYPTNPSTSYDVPQSHGHGQNLTPTGYPGSMISSRGPETLSAPIMSSHSGESSRSNDSAWIPPNKQYHISPSQSLTIAPPPLLSNGDISTAVYTPIHTPTAQQQNRIDPLDVEKQLSDWSQTQIQPDLVAPLPASIQSWRRQANSPLLLGEGQTYRYPSDPPPTQDQSQLPNNVIEANMSRMLSSTRSSFSSSVPPPPPPPPSISHTQSTQTNHRLNHHMPPWESQGFSDKRPHEAIPPPLPWAVDYSSTIPISKPQQQEILPPLLKIRVQNTVASSPISSHGQSQAQSQWTSNQPEEVSVNLKSKKDVGKKFSLSTSINKADLLKKDKIKKSKTAKPTIENEKIDNRDHEASDTSKQPEKKKRKIKGKKEESGRKNELAESASAKSSVVDKSAESSTQNTKAQKQAQDKTNIACNHCRAKKLKCNGEKPNCYHCHRRGETTCSYEAVLRRRGPGKNNKEKEKETEKGKTSRSKNSISTSNSMERGSSENVSASVSRRGNSPRGGSSGSDDDEDEEDQGEQTQREGDIAVHEPQSESNVRIVESFGLGGGGEHGRINGRRLDETELHQMNYILKQQQNADDKVNVGGGSLGMGFGNNLGLGLASKVNMGTGLRGSPTTITPVTNSSSILTGLGGSGSRFELSTARE